MTLAIWIASGQQFNRGTQSGQYVMARKGDIGHHELGNVEILLASENSRQAKTGWSHAIGTRERMSASRSGKPNGKKGAKHIATAWNNGIALSSNHKASISVSLQGLRHRTVVCPHCGTSGGVNNLKRYHFDNCLRVGQGRLPPP